MRRSGKTVPPQMMALSPRREHIIDRKAFMESELEASSQSRVGEKLTELTIRKVRPLGGASGAGQGLQPAHRHTEAGSPHALLGAKTVSMLADTLQCTLHVRTDLSAMGAGRSRTPIYSHTSTQAQPPTFPPYPRGQVIIMVLLVMFAMPVFDVSGEAGGPGNHARAAGRPRRKLTRPGHDSGCHSRRCHDASCAWFTASLVGRGRVQPPSLYQAQCANCTSATLAA